MIIAGAGGRFITVASDYRILFKKDNPYLLAFDALEHTFSSSDNALIAVEPRRGTVFTKEALVALEELTEAAWKTPAFEPGRLLDELQPQPGGGG